MTVATCRLLCEMGDLIVELAARARESKTPYDQLTAPLRDESGNIFPWLEAEAKRRLER